MGKPITAADARRIAHDVVGMHIKHPAPKGHKGLEKVMANYKGAPAVDAKPKPMIHLNDEHVPDGAEVGDEVEMHVKGKVANTSEHASDGEGGPSGSKSMGVEIHSIKHKKKGKKPVGRADGKDADMQDGGKAAMDDALEAEESNEQPE